MFKVTHTTTPAAFSPLPLTNAYNIISTTNSASPASSFSVINRGQLFRSAMFGGFAQVLPRNSTLVLFDNQLRSF